MKGRKYSDEINKTKGHKGKSNPSYRTGYWIVRANHIDKYLKKKCAKCNCLDNLEIHHDPFMDELNCLTWKGKVTTLCRKCHMNKHRDKKGRMKRIYETK